MDKIQTINLLKELGLAPQKRFGQNFLISGSVSEKITKIVLQDESEIIYEIGPGLGALSEYLVKSTKPIKLVEIDHGLAYYLSHHFAQFSHVEVIDKDILKIQFNAQKLSVISNLPYYITTSIIEKVILENAELVNFVFMVQQEVSDRLFASPKSKQYGPLSILLALTGEIKQVINVDQTAFYPAPNVNSVVYAYRPKPNHLNKSEFYSFLKSLFLMRRKTIYNNLSTMVKHKEDALKILHSANIAQNLRPEEITPEQFVIMFDQYRQVNSQ